MPMTIFIKEPSFKTKCFMIQKIYSEMYSTFCANTVHDDRTFEVDRMA